MKCFSDVFSIFVVNFRYFIALCEVVAIHILKTHNFCTFYIQGAAALLFKMRASHRLMSYWSASGLSRGDRIKFCPDTV